MWKPALTDCAAGACSPWMPLQHINWISTFMRLIGDAIIDCAWAMLPPNMRTYFAGHPDMAPYFTAEPPNYVLRRKR